MSRTIRTLLATALLMALLTPLARADVLTLKSGRTVEGKARVVEEKGADGVTTSKIVLQTRYGSVEYPSDQVESIEYGETFEEQLDTALATLAEQADAAREAAAEGEGEGVSAILPSYMELARQCQEEGWTSMSRDLYLHVLSLDDAYLPAREALGYQLVDGQWMTQDELMVAQGLVKFKGEWVHPDEVRATELADYWRGMQRQVDKYKRHMGSKVASRREMGYEQMVALEDRIPGIAAAADVLRDYYDRYYRALAARGEVVAEIRATVATLQRPMQTFETSLATGGLFGNNLVQIQLPELRVTSVKTTVAIPLVESDDDDE